MIKYFMILFISFNINASELETKQAYLVEKLVLQQDYKEIKFSFRGYKLTQDSLNKFYYDIILYSEDVIKLIETKYTNTKIRKEIKIKELNSILNIINQEDFKQHIDYDYTINSLNLLFK